MDNSGENALLQDLTLYFVGIVLVNVFAPVPARSYVVETTGNFQAKGTRHLWTIAGKMLYCKT